MKLTIRDSLLTRCTVFPLLWTVSLSLSTDGQRCLVVKTGAVASLHCSKIHDRLVVSLLKTKMATTPTRKQLTLAS